MFMLHTFALIFHYINMNFYIIKYCIYYNNSTTMHRNSINDSKVLVMGGGINYSGTNHELVRQPVTEIVFTNFRNETERYFLLKYFGILLRYF